VFWVISVYFNIRNTLPKSGTFLLGHPVYIYIYGLGMCHVWVRRGGVWGLGGETGGNETTGET